MVRRTAAAIAICSLVLAHFASGGAIAAPNGHANSHAQANAGGGGGGGNGNGVTGGNGGGNGNGSVVHQYVLANGLKQGQVASQLKSWNSLNANPKAFLSNLNNSNSLLGKEAAYVCANASSRTALQTYDNLVTSAGGDPSKPPTQADATTAQTFLAAEKTLGVLDPKVVVADTTNAYTIEQVTAAKFVLANPALTVATAQTTVAEYNAWAASQTAAQTASIDFAAASVSYKGSSDLTKLQSMVNAIIAQKNLDTSKLCASSTASTQ